jgi:ABC-2 type transport system permease protein
VWRVRHLARKEFWQFQADRLFTAMLMLLPLVQLLLVVNVVSDVTGTGSPAAVVDYDRTDTSRELLAALENTQEAVVRLDLDDIAAGNQSLKRGQTEALAVIPPGFERNLTAHGLPAELLVATDGSHTLSAARVSAAASGALARYAASRTVREDAAGIELRPVKYFRVRLVQDPVSSAYGFLLYQAVLIAAGLGLARERESGTLEQLLVAPFSRFELILGKTLPVLVIGVFDFFLLCAAGRLFWDVPVRGSMGLLFAVAIVFILAECAWGMFLSSRVANQQQAIQIVFVQILFDMAFCGYIVPVQNLPAFMSWLPEVLPLRHYLAILRTVMLKGGGLEDITWHLGALVILNIVCWTLSVRSVSQRLE